MARIDKKFVLSTSQLNSHKFRCLTEGAELADFIANPIMYWLHKTPEGKSKEELMPIGFWEDIKKEGDDITAYPNINDSDPFALSIGKMVEHGTIRSASIEADPIEYDFNKANWLPGQKLPTVKRYTVGEASLVDRGSNKGAIAKLKHAGKSILLSDQASADAYFQSLQNNEKSMKIKLNKKASEALKLAEDSEMDATEVVDKLIEVIEQKNAEVVTLKDGAKKERITLMLNTAKDEGKIVAGQFPSLEKMALREGGEDDVKEYLAGIKPSKSVAEQLRNAVGNDTTDEVKELVKLGYDALFANGGLVKLKALDFDAFKAIHKSKYGKEFTGAEPAK